MNKLWLLAILTISFSSIASSNSDEVSESFSTLEQKTDYTKEIAMAEALQAMMTNLVDVQLEAACSSVVNLEGAIELKKDDQCVMNVNNLRAEITKVPNSKVYLDQVDAFMDRNNIRVLGQ